MILKQKNVKKENRLHRVSFNGLRQTRRSRREEEEAKARSRREFGSQCIERDLWDGDGFTWLVQSDGIIALCQPHTHTNAHKHAHTQSKNTPPPTTSKMWEYRQRKKKSGSCGFPPSSSLCRVTCVCIFMWVCVCEPYNVCPSKVSEQARLQQHPHVPSIYPPVQCLSVSQSGAVACRPPWRFTSARRKPARRTRRRRRCCALGWRTLALLWSRWRCTILPSWDCDSRLCSDRP